MTVSSRMILTAAILCCLPAEVHAQAAQGVLTGRVVDSISQLPVQGATISGATANVSMRTNFDGSFRLTLPAGTSRITVNRAGYHESERDVQVVAGQTLQMQFQLRSLAGGAGGVVVTGYTTQQRDLVSGSIAAIDADPANVGVITNAAQLLTARIAGMNVSMNNGEPGANAQIRIRGGSSIGESNDPLYVIDGLPMQNDELELRGFGIGGTPALGRNPLNAINPADIASITVLKDGSATAMYGVRGANGVVLIETKRGRAGKPVLTYDTYASFGTAASELGFLSGDEYRAFVSAQIASGKLPGARAAELGTASTNWERETQRTSLTQNHNFVFSGGSQSSTFRASLNYAGQQGLVISNGLSRLQGRINATQDALDGRLRLGVNLSSARIENDYLPYENTNGFEGGVFQNVATFNPTRSVFATGAGSQTGAYYEVGTGRQTVRNPVALAEQIADDGVTKRTLGNVTASYAIANSLTAQVNIGGDRSTGRRSIYLPRVSPVGAEFNGLGIYSTRTLQTKNVQALLTWAPLQSAGADLVVLGGFENVNTDREDASLLTRNFTSDAVGFADPGAGTSRSTAVEAESGQLTSYFGRANFGFANRYFVAGTLRRDGTSPFGAQRQWGAFPALSAAWVISQESFAKGLPFSRLALRAGYGRAGKPTIELFSSFSSSAPDVTRQGGAADGALVVARTRADSVTSLTWETTTQSNLALDYEFGSGTVIGSIEYYRKRTDDGLLFLPFVSGGQTVGTGLQNAGAVQFRGFEASLHARLVDRGVGGPAFSAGVVFASERTSVLDIGAASFIETSAVSGQGQSGVNAQRIVAGQPLGTFFGWQFAGFDANGVQTFTRFSVQRDNAGNVTSRVANGVTTTPGFDDKTIIGNANPSYSLGLRSNATWNRFDASWLWRAEQGGDVFNNTALAFASKSLVSQSKNFLRSALSTPESITEPAIYSSRWIEDGSFVRLQNVTVGYTFSLAAHPIRIYLSGDNLLLFTKYTGNDPEVFIDAGLASRGIDYLSYPRSRVFTTGLRIKL